MAKRKPTKAQPVVEKVPERKEAIEVNPEVPVEDQIPLNELPTLFPNSYEIVVAAARRARQLNLGLRPLVKTNMYRPVDVALAELAAGKVEYTAGNQEIKPEPGKRKGKARSK